MNQDSNCRVELCRAYVSGVQPSLCFGGNVVWVSSRFVFGSRSSLAVQNVSHHQFKVLRASLFRTGQNEDDASRMPSRRLLARVLDPLRTGNKWSRLSAMFWLQRQMVVLNGAVTETRSVQPQPPTRCMSSFCQPASVCTNSKMFSSLQRSQQPKCFHQG